MIHIDLLPILVIAVLCLFFIVNIYFTQKIYSYNRFGFLIAIALLTPALLLFVTKRSESVLALNFGLIPLHYTCLLLLIKRTYKKINNYLVNRKFVDNEFLGKDFTYVHWDADIPVSDYWWNEKLASKPSRLDHILTVALFMVPILCTLPVTLLTTNGS